MKELIEEIQKEWNKKYYYPALEDFYIGFEYCLQDQGPIYNENFHEDDEIANVKRGIELGFLFCKYLDKEDVEKVGWKFLHDVYKGGMYELEDYRLQIVDYNDTIKRIYLIQLDYESRILFVGFIKNKSELINQMKRCRIIK